MSQADLLGWLTLLAIILITTLIIKKNPITINFLLTALFLRSLFVILDQYFLTLPDSTGDAEIFEEKAFRYSQEYGINVIFKFYSQDSFNISRFISLAYTFFDRSEFMAKMFSVGFGTVSIFFIFRFAQILWGNNIALKSAWFATLFPSFILYSSLILREVYVVFFLTYALINCVCFIDKKTFFSFIKSLFGFLIAALFHGPVILGLFVFLIYLSLQILKQNNYFIRFKKKNVFLIFLLPLILLPFITYLMGYYSIPKIGNITQFLNKQDANTNIIQKIEDKLILKINLATRSSANNDSGAAYPSWTVPKNILELIYLSPIRMAYFLYAPFPWDIKRLKHLIGLLDALFYVYLSLCIIRSWKVLFHDPKTRFLIMILLIYTFVYSFGVGNFGTGIRHRLKFIGILIVIAAPKIVKIKFSNFK